MKLIFQHIFLLFFTVSIAYAGENSWQPMGLLTLKDRQNKLVSALDSSVYDLINLYSSGQISRENVESKIAQPGIHTTLLDEFGRNFAFDGPADQSFCLELQKRKNQETTVLIPGFGIGRSIADAISIHPNAKIFANDIQIKNKNYAIKFLNKHQINHEHITWLIGGIFEQIDQIKPQSVDLIYFANIVHFLNPYRAKVLFQKMKTILKPEGKIFISWKQNSQSFKTRTKILKECNIIDPNYLEENDFGPFDRVIFPYFSATLEDMKKVIGTENFSYDACGVTCSVSASIQIKEKKPLRLGEYKYLDIEEYNKLGWPKQQITYHMIVSPKNNSSMDFSTNERFYKEEKIYLADRQNQILNKRCSSCKNINAKLKICRGCKKAKYCNRACQVKHWKKHKQECKNN